MKYAITGVDGQLSGKITALMFDEVDADQLILITPFPERIPKENIAAWESAGAVVRKADYSNPDELAKALQGADAGFMVSAMTVGEVRQQQHRNAVDAFKNAGVGRIVYSSGFKADEEVPASVVIVDHHATELYIKQSGLSWNVFRDNLYLENYLYAFAQIALDEGTWRTCAGDTPAYLVAKDDCAAAGAQLLLGHGERNRGYNITGSEAVSVRQLCELVSKHAGIDIVYDSMTEEELYSYYDSLHVPRQATGDFSRSPYLWCSDDIVTNEAAIRDAFLDNKSDDVELLTGRVARTAADLIEGAARSWNLNKA
ncbi:MAG: NmrA family NAD(P)-binding protein [Bifidobacterium psychraerophilum]|uniref:NmrA family NAD(P)-binding protein n=1 Tax=Bifidobacterium psychraerophilum TaxID=218140 RepID=UPI0039ED6A57